ncbi:unnamed protein product, partial [Symbiodinium sp. KB8]
MKPSIAADDGLTNSPESPTNVADQPENSDWSSLERIEQRLSSQTEVTESDACRLVDKFAADAFAVLSRLDNVSRPVLWTAYAYLNRMHYENEALMRLLQEDIMPAEVKTSPEALQHVLKHIKASLFSLLRDRAMVAALTAFDAEAINDDIVIDLLQLTGYKWCPRMKIYEGCLAVDISVAKFAVAKALQKQQANVPRIVLEVLRCSEFPQDRLLEKHLRLLPPKYFTLGNIKPALKELLPKSAAANPLMRMRQSHALIFAGLLNVDLSIPGNKEDLAVFARLWRHEPRVLRHLMKRATEEDALQLQAATYLQSSQSAMRTAIAVTAIVVVAGLLVATIVLGGCLAGAKRALKVPRRPTQGLLVADPSAAAFTTSTPATLSASSRAATTTGSISDAIRFVREQQFPETLAARVTVVTYADAAMARSKAILLRELQPYLDADLVQSVHAYGPEDLYRDPA